MNRGNPIAVAQAFIDEINEGNIDGLTALMTDDHVFVDMADGRSQGRDKMRGNWEGYFKLFPDYQIDIFETHFAGNDIILVGMSTGSLSDFGREMLEKAGKKAVNGEEFQGPAIWRAKIQRGLVAEWQVYRDTKQVRDQFNIPELVTFEDDDDVAALTGGGQGSPWYRWYVLFFLTIASTFSIIDRQIIALMVGPLKRDLGITDGQVGLLMGLIFVGSYTLVTLPMARYADRHSRRLIMAIGIFSWSVITAASGFAKTFWQLAFLRAGVGVGEATLGPATTSMLTDYFPKHRLPLALGIVSSAPFVGVALASIVGGQVIQHLEATPMALPIVGELKSWQALFIIVGLPGVLLALMMFTVAEPKRLGRSGQFSNDGGKGAVPMREVIGFMLERWPVFLFHFSGLLCLATFGWGLLSWNIEFLVRVHGMTKADAGMTYGLISFFFGITGSVFAGWLASMLMARNVPDATLRVIRWAAIVVVVPAVAMLLWGNWLITIILLCPITFIMAMPAGLATSALQVIAPNELRAQMIAFYLIFVNFIGYAMGPWLVGFMSDIFSTGQPNDEGLRYALALLAALFYPTAAICLSLCLGPFRKAVKQAEAWA